MPGVRGLRLAGLRRVLGGGDRARAAAVVPHPHDARREDARPEDDQLPAASSAAARTSWRCSCSAACSSATPTCGSSASRPTPAGCRTSCTGWTTPTSATATGCRRARSCRSCRREYFAENIYVTFQDDWSAFQQADDMNWRRLMWANDFPHSDSTWPWSQEMLAEHTRSCPTEQRQAILVRQRRRALPHRHIRARCRTLLNA